MKLTPLNRPLELHGTGFPTGNVAAPVGSIYTDTAATAGAIRWIKTSGTGTIGWEVEYGDTGWRDITDLLDPGITAKTAIIKRANDEVSWVFDLSIEEGTSAVRLLSNLPAEFLPDQFTYLPPGYLSANGRADAPASLMLPSSDRTWMAAPSGGIAQGNFCTGSSTPWVGPETLKWSGSMKTPRSFPTSLPGIPD